VSLIGLQLLLSSVEVVLGLITLGLLIRSREFKTYWPMLVLSMWQLAPLGVLLYVKHLGQLGRISAKYAYIAYFYTYWTAFACEAVAAIILTYTILHGAMAPLQGLQKLVKIVYFWAAGISLLIAVDVTFTPLVDANHIVQLAVVQFQRATGIITVSLAIFVCIAIRPMGLSFRSRVFGTSLGLVIVSVTSTFDGNYMLQAHQLFGLHSLIQTSIGCVAELAWIYYFAVPEAKRKFVLLPTTSPFHRWNQIAEQFGQNPGVVAIGGVSPDVFATAELEVFRRTSAKMKELEQGELTLPGPPTK
jgi:hypothetical protein